MIKEWLLQIEGGWASDGKGLSIWDVYTTQQNVVADGTTGQVACNSYNLYQRDVEMLKSLGVRIIGLKREFNT